MPIKKSSLKKHCFTMSIKDALELQLVNKQHYPNETCTKINRFHNLPGLSMASHLNSSF